MFKVTEAELKAENENRKKEMAEQGVDEEDMHLLLLDYKFGVTTFWKYYFLTPYGDVLDDGRVKDWHEKPSIIFELHDFFIGKIYPFVTDLIDTQKQINQLSAISALLTKFSAKSLLFVHEDSIVPEAGGIEEIAKAAQRMDGIIRYKGNSGNIPRPHYENTVAQAFTPLNVVNMYLKLSENISGVFGALQGAQPTSGTPAAMYAQQSQNSATSLLALFKAMNSFKTRNAKMMVQLMQQYYTEKRYIFDQTSGERVLWNPDEVRNIDFEISIVENTSTPAYRLMVNEVLMQLKRFDQDNLIDLKGLLEVGNFPFSAKLIDYLNKREQEREEMAQAMQAGEQMQGAPMHQQIPPELQQEMAQYQFSPEVMDAFGKQSPSMQESILQQVAVK
jgi:roadblock/LC7 domain-containing protein